MLTGLVACFRFCRSIYVGVVKLGTTLKSKSTDSEDLMYVLTTRTCVASEFIRYSFYHVKSFTFRGLHYNGN